MSVSPSPFLLRAQRPRRLQVLDELGRRMTLDVGSTTALCLNQGVSGIIILLSLGPEPSFWAGLPLCAEANELYWLECPEFVRQMPEDWERSVPERWKRIRPRDLDFSNLHDTTILAYHPAFRLFSEFWGPITGQLRAGLANIGPFAHAAQAEDPPATATAGNSLLPGPRPVSRTVLLPGDAGGLLTQELEDGFLAEGYRPIRLPEDPEAVLEILRRLLKDDRPALYCSVNLRGLDLEGVVFHLLRACNVPVALWLVDNPWHILSALRLPWWRETLLFVTDQSFVTPLRGHGARFTVWLRCEPLE